ncbi:MAG: T9SS type A sorting domain-containing protein [Bacteroidota bacterium]
MRIIGIISLMVLLGVAAQAQRAYLEIVEKNKRLPFEQIVERVEAYYAGRDKGRGTGYKQFKRWEYYHSHRLTPDGYLQNVPSRVLDEFLSFRNYRSLAPELNFDCQWETVGGTAYQQISNGYNGGIGRVNVVVADPADSDILYAGTPAGGLWRTTNGGGWNPADPSASYWEPLTDGLPAIGVSGVAIDPTSPENNRVIYILTGDGDGRHVPSLGVLKSFDGGDTWFQTGLTWSATELAYGYKLVMHPTDPNTLYAATSRGLWRTTDGGLNWTNEQNGLFTDIEFKPNDPETIYAAEWTRFFRSTDGGENWAALTNPAPNCGITNQGTRMAIAVTPADDEVVYVLVGGTLTNNMGNAVPGTFRGVYRSDDSGDCFTLQSTTPNLLNGRSNGSGARHQSDYDLVIAVSPTDEDQVHVGGINTWRSGDGGASWVLTSFWQEPSAGAGNYTHADIHSMEFIGNTLFVGSDGGVYSSTDDADNWGNLSQGLRITQFYRIAAFTDEDDYIMGGAQDNGLNQLVDGGAGYGNLLHWFGADGFECSPDVASDLIFGSTQRGCLRRYSYPGGGVQDLTVFPNVDSCGGAWLTPHFFDAANDEVWAGYQDVWRSTDDGNNWTNISNGAIGTGVANHMAQAPSDDNVIYVSKGARIFRTTDGGTTWANISSNITPLNQRITYFTVDPTDANRIWLTLSGFLDNNKVFFRDMGTDAIWTNITDNLPNLPPNCIVYENGSADGLYVGLDVGVYYRDNNLSEWVLFSNALPNVIVSELEINYSTGKLYAGTFGRGLWCTDLISSCSELCLDCPTFANFHSQPNTYATENCIVSTAVVYEGAEVNYEAQNFIHLQENFHVQTDLDAIFHAAIRNCDVADARSLRLANLRQLPGYYVGELDDLPTTAEEVATATFAPEQTAEYQVYPNPSSGRLNVELDLRESGTVTIGLFNIVGKRVKMLEVETPFDMGRAVRTYAIDELQNGTYILEITVSGQSQAMTVVKSR